MVIISVVLFQFKPKRGIITFSLSSFLVCSHPLSSNLPSSINLLTSKINLCAAFMFDTLVFQCFCRRTINSIIAFHSFYRFFQMMFYCRFQKKWTCINTKNNSFVTENFVISHASFPYKSKKISVIFMQIKLQKCLFDIRSNSNLFSSEPYEEWWYLLYQIGSLFQTIVKRWLALFFRRHIKNRPYLCSSTTLFHNWVMG